jgi:4-amino-4-deoxy-L-arabinose transferase-like glycosyltransferase
MLLAAVVAAGCILRVAALGSKSFWLDEVLTYKDAVRPLAEILGGGHSSVHPPLLYVISHFLALLGSSEAILRSQAAFFGTLSIPALYWVAKGFVGRGVALAAATLLAFSPFHVEYSQEARHYAMVTFFAIVAFGGFARALRAILDDDARPPLSAYALFIGGGTLALYSHYGAAPLLFSAGLALVAIFARAALAGRRLAARRLLAFAATGFGAMLVLFAPMAMRIAEFAYATLEERPAGAHGLPERVASVPLLAQTEFPLEFLTAISGGVPTLFAAALLLGLVCLARGAASRRVALVLSLWALVPMAVFLAVPSTHRVSERYLLPSLPAFLIVAAAGIAAAAGWIAERFRPFRGKGMATAILLVATVLSGTPALARYYREDPYPWRRSLEIVSQDGSPGDGVVVYPEFLRDILRHYAPVARPARPLFTSDDILRAEKDSTIVDSIWILSSHINNASREKGLDRFRAYFRRTFREDGTVSLGKITLTRFRRLPAARPH